MISLTIYSRTRLQMYKIKSKGDLMTTLKQRRQSGRVKLVTVVIILITLCLSTSVVIGESSKTSTDSSQSIAVSIIGALLVIINGLGLFIMMGMRQDNRDLWDRIYNHEHTIDCGNKECDAKETKGVVVTARIGRR